MNIRRLFLAALVPGLLAIAAGIPTLRFDFAGDDEILILSDPNVQQISRIPNLFRNDFFDRHVEGLPVGGHIGYYRPLTKTTLAVDWALWGRQPSGFHLSNVLLHLTTTLALFALLIALWERLDLALYGATLFSLYPTHPQAVALINARSDILCALGLLLAVGGVIRSRRVLIVLGAAVAVFSKETGFLVLILVALFSWVCWGEWRRWIEQVLSASSAVAAALIFRWTAVGWRSGGTPAASGVGALSYAGKSIGMHLGALSGLDLANPTWLSVPVSFWTWGVLCSWGAMLMMGGLLLWAGKRRSTWGLVLAWPVVGFLPLLSLGRQIHVPEMEAMLPLHLRWTYIPSIGVAMAAALALKRVRPRVVAFLIGGYVVLALPLFWVRVGEYRDESSLGQASFGRLRRVTFDELPVSLQANRLELEGIEAARRGDLEIAVEVLRGAAKRSPDNSRIEGNLGAVLLETGRTDEAISILRDSLAAREVSRYQGVITYETDDADVRGRAGRYALLGEAFFRKGANREAAESLRRALDADPSNAQYALNLGAAYARGGEWARATSEYDHALDLRPCYPKALQALRDIADATKDEGLRASTDRARQRCGG